MKNDLKNSAIATCEEKGRTLGLVRSDLTKLTNYEKALKLLEERADSESEVLQELVERATPKKPTVYAELNTYGGTDEWLQCPQCSYDTMNDDLGKYSFYPNCGQRLDWSE